MNRAELVFIPAIGAGHILSTVEMAKLLAERDDRLSITVLIMNLRNDSNNTHSTTDRIRFVDLPCIELTCEGNNDLKYITLLVESHKSHVREAVTNLAKSGRLAGFVLDMFCTAMIDVADEFGVPSYVFFTSSAAFLGVELHALRLRDEDNVSEFNLSDGDLVVPSLVNPLPPKVLPSVLLEKEAATTFLEHIRGLTKAKGILVNSFTELESHAIHSFSTGKSHCPTVYPVGPILSMKDHSLDLSNSGVHERPDVMKWLDDQPPSSVVFLCFGSMGSFGEDQVKEIALALELSGQRFLWSLRQPQQNNNVRSPPTDCTNPQEILPEGFLDRTAGTGKIIGWAPQVAILAHAAIGGFVSHCGWNSTLESLRFGVPIATWPLYAEQQFNAFEMVRELGLAVEIKIDYRKHQPTLAAEEIERGIRCVMEQESEVRKRVKQMGEASRKALMHGGSSHSALGRFIQDVMHNMAPTN